METERAQHQQSSRQHQLLYRHGEETQQLQETHGIQRTRSQVVRQIYVLERQETMLQYAS